MPDVFRQPYEKLLWSGRRADSMSGLLNFLPPVPTRWYAGSPDLIPADRGRKRFFQWCGM